MKIAYRLFVTATLAVLAYGVMIAAHTPEPWWIAGPAVVLALLGAFKTPKRGSTPAPEST